nr:hypothetical protein [Tanacetum cinerariifolium]GEV33463.1 hypothetical protein [Tanacetum cinerariifolium]
MLLTMGKGLGTPTKPHHTPTPEAPQSSQHELSSSSLSPIITKPIPTVIPTVAPPLRQYTRRARIAQSSALPTVADKLASPLGDDSQGEAFSTVFGLEAEQERETIIKTSSLPHNSTPRVTSLTADEGNKDGGVADQFGDDAPIKGRSLESGEETSLARSTERGKVATATISVPTVSGIVPTASPIFKTASVITSHTKRKGKKKMIEDARIARIHVEEELQMLIDRLDRSNEVIARHLQEYKNVAADLSIGEKIDLINELVKYEDHHTKILKYQAQQSKPLKKKQQREFYTSVLRNHDGWKTQHFKGVSLEEIKEMFDPVWKQIQDFVPIGSKEEGEIFKRKGIRLEQDSTKKVKTSKEVPEENLKEMMKLIPVEELWALVKETFSIKQATSDKEKELWVELKRLYESNIKDKQWIHTQAMMHAPIEWKLYDSCGVHHVVFKDQEIFMLVEKDYPLSVNSDDQL